MATLPELAALCIAEPIPILLLDTCALLDLIRIAGRENPADPTPAPEIASAARKILALTQQTVPKIRLICYELVSREWDDNEKEVAKGPRAALRRARDLLGRFNDTAASLSIPEQIYRPGQIAERDGELVITLLTDLSQRVLAASHQLKRLDLCEKRAVQRSINNIRPASKGKPELKDCIIIEHYLELCRQLPPTITRLLVSSNVNDYGKSLSLFSPLDQEFVAVGLNWALSFAHAHSMLVDKSLVSEK